jgi:hypothetical protein
MDTVTVRDLRNNGEKFCVASSTASASSLLATERRWLSSAPFLDPAPDRPNSFVAARILGRARIGAAISRADIGAFLVSQLADTRYRPAMPAISN